MKQLFYRLLLWALLFLPITVLPAIELKILCWNVENLFDSLDDPAKEDRSVSPESYANKVETLALWLTEFDAHIVGLCEVENISITEELAKKAGYSYFYHIEGNDPSGIDVSMLSRYELQYKSHRNHPTPYEGNRNYRFSRDCVEAELMIDGISLTILLTHLKAAGSHQEEDLRKRLAQTRGLLDIISTVYEKESRPYLLLMGDLNAPRSSEPIRMLQKSGLKVLNYLRSQDTFYTYLYRGVKEDLDYIIFNDHLFESSKINTFKTIHHKEIETVSDHYPIFLHFHLEAL